MCECVALLLLPRESFMGPLRSGGGGPTTSLGCHRVSISLEGFGTTTREEEKYCGGGRTRNMAINISSPSSSLFPQRGTRKSFFFGVWGNAFVTLWREGCFSKRREGCTREGGAISKPITSLITEGSSLLGVGLKKQKKEGGRVTVAKLPIILHFLL